MVNPVMEQPRAVPRWVKRLYVGLIILSIGWMIYQHDSLTPVLGRLKDVAIFGFLMAANEVLFTGGLILIALSLGYGVFSGTGFSPIKWVRAVRDIKARATELIHSGRGSRMFRFGFYCNFIGAVGFGLIPLVGIFVLLPPSAWPAVAPLVLDIILGLVIRVPIQRKIREIRRQEVAQ